MIGARRSFVPRRPAGPDRPRARQAWVALLERAALVGDAAAEGQSLTVLDGKAFAGEVIRTGDLPFPLPFESARQAASGFRLIARGFVAAIDPELSAELGRAMAAAARCCRRLIERDTEDQAAAWRKRHPED